MLALLPWMRRLALLRTLLRAAHLLLGLAVLIGLQQLGSSIARIAGVPVPGSVVGMLLLAGALGSGLVPAPVVRRAVEPLLRHLSLLYVPAGVALVRYGDVLRREWLPIAGGAVASLLAVLVLVGFTAGRGAGGGERLDVTEAIGEAR